MSFKEELQKLSVQIIERKKHITNEEMTKQALIIPFLQVIGYDVFNPLEVKPEFISDFGKKKGEKVDYAIFKDGKPIIFIEAKAVTENTNNHDSQLARYFNATTEVKLAIITNGVIYKFFTDVDSNNIMDDNPFAIINITDLSINDIEVLSKFKKEAFETESLVKYAEDLIYTSNLNIKLKDLLKNPSDDFIRLLIKNLSDTKITTNVIERFKPIVKKSISNAILDIVSQGIFQQEAAPTTEEEKLIQTEEALNDEQITKKQIATTEEEINGFEIIKEILVSNGRNISNLQYKDTVNYFGIFIKSIFNWFIRLNFNSTSKYLIVRLPVKIVSQTVSNYKIEPAPKGHGEDSSRIFIESLNDFHNLENLILECYDYISKGE
jgi:hypothetical protein